MTRGLTILGAPSHIGIRPYDDGTPRALDRAPAALREAGLTAALGAADAGDVHTEPYRDVVRPPGRARNEPEVARHAHALADAVARLVDDGRFVVLLGGDCSIVLGGLLGLRRAGRGRVGLAYVDAHDDFATPEESGTGSVASMCLALAVGRGDTPLATLGGAAPLVRGADVALVGTRPEDEEPWYDDAAFRASGALHLPHDEAHRRGYAAIAGDVLARVARDDLDGFWIHVDADVLSPAVMPAVDSPVRGGPDVDELAPFLAALARHPKALGLQLTIYDPGLDPDGACARRLVSLLARAAVA